MQTPKPPVQFSEDLADRICTLIGNGKSLRQISRIRGMPDVGTILRWSKRMPEGFGQQYREAMAARAFHLGEEVVEIADAAKLGADDLRKAGLRIESRKWMAGRMDPKTFGDRTTVGHQQLDALGNATDPKSINILVVAMDRLTTDELRVLIHLYQKMGVQMPGTEPPTIEHGGDREGDGDEEGE